MKHDLHILHKSIDPSKFDIYVINCGNNRYSTLVKKATFEFESDAVSVMKSKSFVKQKPDENINVYMDSSIKKPVSIYMYLLKPNVVTAVSVDPSSSDITRDVFPDNTDYREQFLNLMQKIRRDEDKKAPKRPRVITDSSTTVTVLKSEKKAPKRPRIITDSSITVTITKPEKTHPDVTQQVMVKVASIEPEVDSRRSSSRLNNTKQTDNNISSTSALAAGPRPTENWFSRLVNKLKPVRGQVSKPGAVTNTNTNTSYNADESEAFGNLFSRNNIKKAAAPLPTEPLGSKVVWPSLLAASPSQAVATAPSSVETLAAPTQPASVETLAADHIAVPGTLQSTTAALPPPSPTTQYPAQHHDKRGQPVTADKGLKLRNENTKPPPVAAHPKPKQPKAEAPFQVAWPNLESYSTGTAPSLPVAPSTATPLPQSTTANTSQSVANTSQSTIANTSQPTVANTSQANPSQYDLEEFEKEIMQLVEEKLKYQEATQKS